MEKATDWVEWVLTCGTVAASVIILFLFLKRDWKRYGGLFLLSSCVGLILCELFLLLGFYVFPFHLFSSIFNMPVAELGLSFPVIVLLTVTFSPRRWPWKIPFYWGVVHLGIIAETWALSETSIINYSYKWHLWESYTWWWIYLLIFEWIGGLLIPAELRRPLAIRHLRVGKLGWAILHFILIITIFLGGYYMGTLRK